MTEPEPVEEPQPTYTPDDPGVIVTPVIPPTPPRPTPPRPPNPRKNVEDE